MSKEHALPKWLGKNLPDADPHPTVHLFDGQKGGFYDEGRPAPNQAFGHETRVACVPCNTGWMNDLETAVEPLLVPLMRGDPSSLRETELKTLAAWAFKTASMLGCLGPADARMPAPHYRWLHNKKRPPETCQIWLVPMIDGPQSGEWAKYVASVGIGDPAARKGLPMNTYAFQFLLGKVGFIVYGTERPDLVPPVEAVLAAPGTLTPIWPLPRSLDWEPPGPARQPEWLANSLLNLRNFLWNQGLA
jgi:hypothetical protein